MSWKTPGIALGVCLVTIAVLDAGQSTAPKAGTLTAQDEAEIRQLSQKYATALGLCKAEEYAAVFTADGFYSSSEFMGARHREMYGTKGGKIPRSEMVPFVMSEPQCTDAAAPKTPRAAPATIVITPSPGGATGVIPLANGNKYEDVYVKTAQGWRIKSREHVRAGQQAFSKRAQ
jgi:hypothetical protein